MSDLKKIELLLLENDYLDIEFQNEEKLQDGTIVYYFHGYIDDEMKIKVLLKGNEVEIMDSYTGEDSYVTWLKTKI